MNRQQKKDLLKGILSGDKQELYAMMPLFPEGEIETFSEIQPGVFLNTITGQRLDEEKQRYYLRLQNFNDEGETLVSPIRIYVYPGMPQ
jgi:hypothetical protein